MICADNYFFAEHGVNGLMDPVEPGLACGSDTAHMSIFGYDPRLFVLQKVFSNWYKILQGTWFI